MNLPKVQRDTIHFNNELFFSEIGGLIASPLFAYLAFHINPEPEFIALFAVLGSIVGGTTFWLVTRIRNNRKRGCFSMGKLTKDVVCYSPASIIFTFLIYQPTLFVVSTRLLIRGHSVLASVILGQSLAFLLFSITLNVYRILLEKTTGRRL